MNKFTLSLIAAGVLTASHCASAQLSPLRVQGSSLVDDQGQEVVLRAINLGNWLMIEPWMLGLNTGVTPDQATFLSVLESRFGAAEAERLMDIYRSGYITDRDMQHIASLGFNAVRLPFDHALIERIDAPFEVRDDGFEWIDRALDMAEDAGLYVILDMHGAPGGQSLDQPSGDRTENNLWGNDQAQERLAWIWQRIARRYKSHPAFAAYDMLNEPFGDFVTDYSNELISITQRVHDAVRLIDPDRPIFIPGTINGIDFYGKPSDRGWSGIGFTEHFYPGLFDGQDPTMAVHARFLQGRLVERALRTQSLEAPYFVGEFNPVWDFAGNPDLLRIYADRAEAVGVSTAWWSYKILKPSGGVGGNNWYLVTNTNDLGLGTNLFEPSLATIESVFTSFATMPLSSDLAAEASLAAANPNDPLPTVYAPLAIIPDATAPVGWGLVQIGTSDEGSADPSGGGFAAVYASGSDIFGSQDEFQFLHQSASGSTAVSAVIDRFDAEAQFAKSGVMLRAGLQADSAHAMVHVLADGRVYLLYRTSTNASSGQVFLGTTSFPAGLAIETNGSSITAWYTDSEGAWRSSGFPQSVNLGGAFQAGYASNSYEDRLYSSTVIDSLSIASSLTLPSVPAPATAPDFMVNGSFESASNASTPSGWSLSDTLVRRQTGWLPVRDGNALLAYRHWEASSSATSSATTTIGGLTPGQRYEVVVPSNRDTVPGGAQLAESITLEVEEFSTTGRIIDKRVYPVDQIETGNEWSRLTLPFEATSSSITVRLTFAPASGGNRDGAVKFDEVRVIQRP
ncbi:MAG: cellulase family glycosylhydrolase [Planctomycetota bacterium]